MRFESTRNLAIHTADMQTAHDFYVGRLGFRVVSKTDQKLVLETGRIRLYVNADDELMPFIPALAVDDLDAARGHVIKGGAEIVREWKPERSLYLRDPLGIVWDLIEDPVGPESELVAGLHRDWFTRSWSFDMPPDLYPEIMERLRGTPVRLRTATEGLGSDVLSHRGGYDWSIQENVGHLGDLDQLFRTRIEDFLEGAEELRPADMSNQVTNQADHESRRLEDVLAYVSDQRMGLLAQLEELSPADFARDSYHRRLDMQMRLIDQCVFQASHDDYHLALITALKREYPEGGADDTPKGHAQ